MRMGKKMKGRGRWREGGDYKRKETAGKQRVTIKRRAKNVRKAGERGKEVRVL